MLHVYRLRILYLRLLKCMYSFHLSLCDNDVLFKLSVLPLLH